MEKVTFINSQGLSVVLGNERPFILTKFEGTGAVAADIQTQKSPFQDGVTYIDNTLGERPLSLEVMLLAKNAVEMERHRRKLLQVFNAKLGPGRLVYEFGGNKKEIEAIAELAPVFPDAGDFSDTMQPGLISLYCPNPFWRDVAKTKAEVAIWRGAFEFPLEIVTGGIEMGFREPSLIVNIENPGDVACGMEIRFKALATVVNPLLFNVNTREFIKINKTLTAGEVLTVTTHFANKRVETYKNGITSNAFNWIDLESTFLQLDPGDNLLRYDAEDGLDNLEVDIYYNPQYVGV